MTQIKYETDLQKYPDLVRTYNKYGIDNNTIAKDPTKAAEATILRLLHGPNTPYHYSDNTEIPKATALGI